MTKYYPRSHAVGQEGADFVATVVRSMGFKWIIRPGDSDSGIDGEVELRNPQSGEVSGLCLAVQIKSTDADLGSSSGVEYRCSAADLNYWLSSFTPVLLILVSIREQKAWFVNIHDYLKRHSSHTSGRTIHFDRIQDRFDASAWEKLATIATMAVRRLDITHSPPEFISASTLARFYTALSTALSDVALEQRVGELPLFMDADAVVLGVKPISQATYHSYRRPADMGSFCETLWRLGYLGSTPVLSPHLVELSNVFKTLPSTQGAYHRSAAREMLLTLQDALHAPGDRVHHFMEALRTAPLDLVSLAATLAFPLRDRMRQAGSVLDLNRPMDDMSSIVNSPNFVRVARHIESLRARSAPFRFLDQLITRQSVTRNSMTDAASLMLLANYLEEYHRGTRSAPPLFYSRTTSVQDTMHNREFINMFALSDTLRRDGTPLDGRPHTISRSPEYLLCRATFRSLRRPSARMINNALHEKTSLEFSDLKECVGELRMVIERLGRPPYTDKTMFEWERVIRDKWSLVGVIEYLNSIARTETLWLDDSGMLLDVLGTAASVRGIKGFVDSNRAAMDHWLQTSSGDAISRFQSIADRL